MKEDFLHVPEQARGRSERVHSSTCVPLHAKLCESWRRHGSLGVSHNTYVRHRSEHSHWTQYRSAKMMTHLAAELLGFETHATYASSRSTRQITQSRLASRSSHRPFSTQRDRSVRSPASDFAVRPLVTAAAAAVAEPDINQHVREGASEAELVQLQVIIALRCLVSFKRTGVVAVGSNLETVEGPGCKSSSNAATGSQDGCGAAAASGCAASFRPALWGRRGSRRGLRSRRAVTCRRAGSPRCRRRSDR